MGGHSLFPTKPVGDKECGGPHFSIIKNRKLIVNSVTVKILSQASYTVTVRTVCMYLEHLYSSIIVFYH